MDWGHVVITGHAGILFANTDGAPVIFSATTAVAKLKEPIAANNMAGLAMLATGTCVLLMSVRDSAFCDE